MTMRLNTDDIKTMAETDVTIKPDWFEANLYAEEEEEEGFLAGIANNIGIRDSSLADLSIDEVFDGYRDLYQSIVEVGEEYGREFERTIGMKGVDVDYREGRAVSFNGGLRDTLDNVEAESFEEAQELVELSPDNNSGYEVKGLYGVDFALDGDGVTVHTRYERPYRKYDRPGRIQTTFLFDEDVDVEEVVAYREMLLSQDFRVGELRASVER